MDNLGLTTRKPLAGTMHHSDRGSQYTSYEFGKALRASGLLASMGRVGSAFDNALADQQVQSAPLPSSVGSMVQPMPYAGLFEPAGRLAVGFRG